MRKLRKIALGIKTVRGPFGGGNQFAKTLARYLEMNNIAPVFSLRDPDIDLIVVTDTRAWLSSCAFDMRSALRYAARHPHTKIILRINECDQRKGHTSQLLNRLIIASSEAADHIVFISSFLRSLFPALSRPDSVIRNGADVGTFNRSGFRPWDGQSCLKLVTHHWSSHPYKGWDIYQALDELIGKSITDIEFTFIGRAPAGISLTSTRLRAPLYGNELAAALKQHHAYITASRHEPAGMHHIEAAACGLPLLYRESGALPEYCHGFGIPFLDQRDLHHALARLRLHYAYLVDKLRSYPHTSDRMCRDYLNLFERIHRQPPAARRPWLPAAVRISAAAMPLRLTQYLS